MITPDLHDLPVLIDRLTRTRPPGSRKVVFLVGAPLSAPELKGQRGVPGTSGMIELIREEIGDAFGKTESFNAKIANCENPYQAAFEQLIAHRGQDMANEIVRRSVMKARTPPQEIARNLTVDLDPESLNAFENNVEGWTLPIGIRSLGRIIADHPETFGKTVLTSNFDPLIEVSIRRSGGRYYRTILHRDGDLSQSSADGCHVVHFHGFWIGRDTLHTPGQLCQDRPRLRQSLARLLRSSSVVVLAYGGWDDIFTTALLDVVMDDDAQPDILWTFHESTNPLNNSGNRRLVEKLEPGISRGRITLFKGIDCNTFLPRLLQELTDERPGGAIQLSDNVSTRFVRVTDSDAREPRLELRIRIPDDAALERETDSPPQTDEWVGRESEMHLMEANSTPTAVITGIGGQGKSALAARYLRQQSNQKLFEEWDWRDCREESDRINTQLIHIIVRLSAGRIDPSALDSLDLRSLIDTFFGTLGDRRWLFVFDNVDHYVDLVTGDFVSGVGQLFDAVVARQHRSRFLFTCRPEVRTENPRVLHLPLEGLSETETMELFRRHGVSEVERENMRVAFALTRGHPMWVNMIAMQVVRMRRSLSEVLEGIKSGKGELPEKTLRSIWSSLNDNQQTVLRTLGECERPEPQERLGDIMQGLQWNRLDKALRTLRALHLVVVKSRQGEPDLLELHPLVRSFIRKEFPRQDRDRFISVIIDFLDRMIGKYKGLLNKQPSFAVLEHWTQKAELDINRGHYQDAVTTLVEVARDLMSRGYTEELVRIGKKLLAELPWADACLSYRHFDELVQKLMQAMTQLGQFQETDGYLKRYGEAIPGKSAQYINLCDLRCYLNWYREDFHLAITWGEEGEELRATSKVDTKFSTGHNLALARRDGGQIEKALEFFLQGASMGEVLDPALIDSKRGGTFYGNIGRCFSLSGRFPEAQIVYKKSATLLDVAADEHTKLNMGYVRLWIGEVLEKLGKRDLAEVFFLAAVYQWYEISPPRARSAEKAFREIAPNGFIVFPPNSGDAMRVEQRVRNWLLS